MTRGLRLPAWATDDAASIEREAEPYRAMTPEQRGHLLALACHAGARLLRSRADAVVFLIFAATLFAAAAWFGWRLRYS